MAEKVTDEMISRVMRELGKRGGEAEVPKGTAMLSPEERKERARQAALARWGKKRAAPRTKKRAGSSSKTKQPKS